MFRLKRKEITGRWKRPPSQDVHNLFSSSHTIKDHEMRSIFRISSNVILFREYCFIIGSPKLVKLLLYLKYPAIKRTRGMNVMLQTFLTSAVAAVHAARS